MINCFKKTIVMISIYLCLVISIRAVAETNSKPDGLPWGLHFYESIEEAKNYEFFSHEPEVTEDGRQIWGFAEIFDETAMLRMGSQMDVPSENNMSISITFFIPCDEAVVFYNKLFDECAQRWEVPCSPKFLYLEGDGLEQILVPYEHEVELIEVLQLEADSRIWCTWEWEDGDKQYSLIASHIISGMTTFSLSIFN